MRREGGKKEMLDYGANGVQGSAVARRLLEAGHAVRGLVRDDRGAGVLRGAAQSQPSAICSTRRACGRPPTAAMRYS